MAGVGFAPAAKRLGFVGVPEKGDGVVIGADAVLRLSGELRRPVDDGEGVQPVLHDDSRGGVARRARLRALVVRGVHGITGVSLSAHARQSFTSPDSVMT